MNFTKKAREKRDKDQSAITDWGDSLTKQEYKDEVNANRIIEKARKGQFIAGSVRTGFYEDVTHMPSSYQEALTKIKQVEDDFSNIPSEVRKRFGNDPEALANWVLDPNNQKEALELGLLEPEVVPEPVKVEVTNTPESSQEAP